MPAPTRRFVVALVLALVAVLAPVAVGGTALAGPDSTAAQTVPEPVAAGPHATSGARTSDAVRVADAPGADAVTPPGPALDALVPILPEPVVAVVGYAGPPGPDPGHGAAAGSRGPPATV